jgi:hypothetical protein
MTLFLFFTSFKDNISNPYPYSVNSLDINPIVMISKESIEQQMNEILHYYNQQNNEPGLNN